MWSYFDDVAVRNSMVKLKFNLDDQFEIYGYFLFQTLGCGVMPSIFQSIFLYACMGLPAPSLQLQFKQYMAILREGMFRPTGL